MALENSYVCAVCGATVENRYEAKIHARKHRSASLTELFGEGATAAPAAKGAPQTVKDGVKNAEAEGIRIRPGAGAGAEVEIK